MPSSSSSSTMTSTEKSIANVGRLLPAELLSEMVKFSPLDGLKTCAQANRVLSSYARPMAHKKREMIDKLCFAPIRELADWFRAISLEIASIRDTIYQNAFVQLRSLVKRWYDCPKPEKSKWEVLNQYKMELRQIMTELNPFYLAITRVMDKVYEIEMRLDGEEDFLCRFQLSYTTRGQINRLRVAQISSALGLAQAEMGHWRHEDVSRWRGMLKSFGALVCREFPNEIKFCDDEIHSCTQQVMICESILDITILQFSAKYSNI